MPAETQRMMQEMLGQARALRAEAALSAARSALAALQADPDDQAALDALLGDTPAAITATRAALRAALEAEQPEAGAIAQLHDLLKQFSPDWEGFSADASLDEKIAALESLQAPTN